MRSIFAALLIFVLSGCVVVPERPAPGADYGPPPEQYEAAVKDHFRHQFADPAAAIYVIKPPVRAYRNQMPAWGARLLWFGYLVEVRVAERQGAGDFAYRVLFTGEQIVDVLEGSMDLQVRLAL